MPLHPTLSNHTEDVVSKYTMALHGKNKHIHVSVPNHYPEIDTEAYGLVCVSTNPCFAAYMTNLLEQDGSGVTTPPEAKFPLD